MQNHRITKLLLTVVGALGVMSASNILCAATPVTFYDVFVVDDPHDKPVRPDLTIMPKAPDVRLNKIDSDVQDSVRNVLGEPAQNIPPFIPDQQYDRVIDMVFAIDTTGSMGGLIDGAKQKVWRIINDVTQKQKNSNKKVLVRVGLVAYRDQQDEYQTSITPLSADLDYVYSQLMGFQAQGGGDTPENVRLAMSDALNRVGWTKPAYSRLGNVSQILFLVGDAPPHDDYQQYPSTQKTAVNARRQGIFVNTIQVGSIRETAPIWREIAQQGGGEYFAIAQNGGVQTVVTPYDDRLAKLGDEMSAKGLYYGKMRAQLAADSAGYASSMSAAPMSAKADRAVNKAINAESAYNFRDLVQAIENKTVQLSDIKKEDLPDDMQKMSVTEQQAHIDKKIAERTELRKQITELSKQRDAYLREHEKGAADAFDSAVGKALDKQIP